MMYFHLSTFERYVNFEFYKTTFTTFLASSKFERYVNFEFYKTCENYRGACRSLRDM